MTAVHEVRHLPGLAPEVRLPEEIALPALRDGKPVATYALVSGGHDSAAVARWAVEHVQDLTGLLHIDTTIGVDETREYVRCLARELGAPLVVASRDDAGNGYRELVQQFGFPGPGFHGLPYALLKERALRRVVRDAKIGHSRSARVALISGSRRQESQRRMGLNVPVTRVGAQLWINPFFDYSKAQLTAYRLSAGVPDNYVALLLGKSGECFCGAYAKQGELEDTTALGYPAVEQQIRALERDMRRQGHPACRWGERPPPRIAEQQRAAGQLELPTAYMPMCIGCGAEPDDERAGTTSA
jgi:3'-phosphoadenosine 5'-phosphosulfate sulfotransferase (PAPS reductase)/FAD synthetase